MNHPGHAHTRDTAPHATGTRTAGEKGSGRTGTPPEQSQSRTEAHNGGQQSKPLELTVFPRPIMKAHHRGPAPYVNMVSGDLMSEHGANMLAGAKRLTDAELAAEAYRQIALGNEAMALLFKARWRGEVEAMVTQGTREAVIERARTLTRFASSPHYFEVDQ